jgi:hypothetical protein
MELFSSLVSSILIPNKPESKRPLVRPRRRWKCNIRIGLRETGWDVD